MCKFIGIFVCARESKTAYRSDEGVYLATKIKQFFLEDYI